MQEKYKKIQKILSNNKKVVENYFFMTVLQILNSFFYLLIYPYLIRTLGTESYGLYVFAYSIVIYFITAVTFGCDMPAVKVIAENPNDKALKEKVLSCIFTAKVYLEIAAAIIFAGLIFAIPSLRSNWMIYSILFTMTLTNIIFPQWYFQGIQKMRIVTVIQLIFKLLSLPFIFWLVKSSDDISVFAVCMSAASVLGGITAMLMIRFNEKLQIRWQSISALKVWYKDGLPFFMSSSVGVLKEQSIVQIIGIMFGLHEVAIYDLANKIIVVPRTIFANINGALFPKVIVNINNMTVKKIICSEYLLSIATILLIAVFGKFVVFFMGGKVMLAAYPVAIILSFTIVCWMVVGAYNYFIFIPKNLYYVITKNQVISLVSMFVYLLIGLIFAQNVFVLSAAIALSGLTEIVYCKIVINRRKLLQNAL